MRGPLLRGTTSFLLPLRVDDATSTSGAALTSIPASGITARYWREGDTAWTTVTVVPGTLGSWITGGWAEMGRGKFEFSVPNLALQQGKWALFEFYGYPNMVPCEVYLPLWSIDPQDALRAGVGALPAASAGAASGLITAGSTGQQFPTNAITSGAIRSDAGFWLADHFLTRDWTQIFLTNPARSLWQAARFLRNKWYLNANPVVNTLHVTREDDATDAWTAVVSGTTGADPITGADPT